MFTTRKDAVYNCLTQTNTAEHRAMKNIQTAFKSYQEVVLKCGQNSLAAKSAWATVLVERTRALAERQVYAPK